ncbi:MAG TPA: DUF1801 domain-containing protein [Verrucomicrobiales bacterium]|nr:DUF1801 domain-containing protein [Verrucomicrobiales bacterium]
MQSKAASVEQYLAELPPERRSAIEAVRKVILRSIDKDVEEGMQYGMIGYYIPHRVYPPGYHCDPKQPLPFVCLASQKNHMAVYMSCIYGSEAEERWFREAWAKTGKKLDMGKSCIRFRKPDDLALDVLGEAIRRTPTKKFIEFYEKVLKDQRRKTAKARPAGTKSKPTGRTAPQRASVQSARSSSTKRGRQTSKG